MSVVGWSTSQGAPPAPLAHEWRLIDGKHWQIAPATPSSSVDHGLRDAAESTGGRCTEGMVEVEGHMLVDGWGDFDVVDALQRSVCMNWISRTFPERCARFDEQRWRVLSADILSPSCSATSGLPRSVGTASESSPNTSRSRPAR